jgi:pilus assembly protein CpaE
VSARILLVLLEGATGERISDPLLSRGHDVQQVGGATAAAGRLEGRELIIVDAAAATDAAVDACKRLRQKAGADVPILAIAASDSIEARISLFEAGADDVLGSTFDRRELEAIIEALLARQQPAVGGQAIDDLPLGPGRVIVFAAARGGAGSTTLAVNTALLLAGQRSSVAVADLDLHRGQVASHLNVTNSATYSTAHLAREEQVARSPQLLHASAVAHPSGLAVFPAPNRPDESGMVTVDDAVELVKTLRNAYQVVVVDAGSLIASRAIALLTLADRGVMVVTPDIPGLRAVQGAIEALNDAGALGEQMRFVLNQPFAHGAIDREDIERHLVVPLALQVPYDGENSIRAANSGQPISELAPRSAMADALRKLSALVSEQQGGQPAEQHDTERRSGRLGGLLRRT